MVTIETGLKISLALASLALSACASSTEANRRFASVDDGVSAASAVKSVFTSSNYTGTGANGVCTISVSFQGNQGYMLNIFYPQDTNPMTSHDTLVVGEDEVSVSSAEQINDGSRLHIIEHVRYPGGGDLGRASSGAEELTVAHDGTVTIKNNKDQPISCKVGI